MASRAVACRQWRRARIVVLAACVASGCVVSFEGYGPEESTGTAGNGATSSTTSGGGSTASNGGGGSGGGSGADGGTAAGGEGGRGGSAGAGNGGAPANCPTEGGPMISLTAPAGDFCIDRTEVTQGRYQAFLSAGPDPSQQIAACTSNGSFMPTCDFTPVSSPDRPVVCVDWCDAYAFCAFVGKRLCGKIGGGAGTVAGADDPAASQWYRACSEAGARIYPYGNLYEGDWCNGLDSPFTGTADVALLAQCVGGYPDLHDMSGNAREWEDACDGNNCVQRGGSWLSSDTSSPHSLRCDSAGVGARNQANGEIGFRCCADL